MNLQIIKVIDKPILSFDTWTLKTKIADTIENKIKYGIPVSPIYEKPKKIVKEESTSVIEYDNKLISLTFDEGDPEYIDSLVEVLNRNKSRATFFILGNSIDNNAERLIKLASYGNEIGIQGYNKTPFIQKDISDVKFEISYTCERLKEIGVIPSRIVRPPHDLLNNTIKEHIDMPLVLSSVNLSDASEDEIKNKISSNIRPGSIIKLKSNEVTLNALNEIIPELIKEGYKFVTVSEMNRQYSSKLEPGKVYAYINNKKAA